MGSGLILKFRALTPRKMVIHKQNNADCSDPVSKLLAGKYDGFYGEPNNYGSDTYDF